MALNMLLCSVWAELTRTLKKTKLRMKPNTTEEAVKPDGNTEKHGREQRYVCTFTKGEIIMYIVRQKSRSSPLYFFLLGSDLLLPIQRVKE